MSEIPKPIDEREGFPTIFKKHFDTLVKSVTRIVQSEPGESVISIVQSSIINCVNGIRASLDLSPLPEGAADCAIISPSEAHPQAGMAVLAIQARDGNQVIGSYEFQEEGGNRDVFTLTDPAVLEEAVWNILRANK